MKTDPQRKAWLASLKPGDLVMTYGNDICQWVVKRVLLTRIILSRAESHAGGFSVSRKRRQLLDTIQAARWSDVPVKDLRRIVAIVDKCKAGR